MNDIDKSLLRIAQDILRITTLETRNNNMRDFHDLPVWDIKSALEAAFFAGQNSASSAVARSLERVKS
jgi:hypothetical protein